MQTFQPARLTALRCIEEMTAKELAVKLGVTPASVSHWEAGRTIPSVAMAHQLKLIFAVPSDFFFEPLEPAPASDEAWYRARARVPARVKKRVLWLGTLFKESIENCEDLGLVKVRPHRTPNLKDLDPTAAATVVREQLGLYPHQPIGNMIQILEHYGIWVHELAEDESDLIDAFAVWFEGRPMVFLNPSKADPFRARFNGAHEFRHITSHEHVEPKGPEHKAQENDANAFAAELLVPLEAWLKEAPRRSPTNPFVYLRHKAKWGVSIAFLMRRSHTAGILSKQAYTSACVRYSKARMRRGEPILRGSQPPYEAPTLMRDVLSATGMDTAELAELMSYGNWLGGEVFGLGGGAGVEVAPGRVLRLA